MSNLSGVLFFQQNILPFPPVLSTVEAAPCTGRHVTCLWTSSLASARCNFSEFCRGPLSRKCQVFARAKPRRLLLPSPGFLACPPSLPACPCDLRSLAKVSPWPTASSPSNLFAPPVHMTFYRSKFRTLHLFILHTSKLNLKVWFQTFLAYKHL